MEVHTMTRQLETSPLAAVATVSSPILRGEAAQCPKIEHESGLQSRGDTPPGLPKPTFLCQNSLAQPVGRKPINFGEAATKNDSSTHRGPKEAPPPSPGERVGATLFQFLVESSIMRSNEEKRNSSEDESEETHEGDMYDEPAAGSMRLRVRPKRILSADFGAMESSEEEEDGAMYHNDDDFEEQGTAYRRTTNLRADQGSRARPRSASSRRATRRKDPANLNVDEILSRKRLGGLSFREAAIVILKQEKRPLGTKQIAKIALQRGLIESTGKTPHHSFAGLLSNEIRRNSDTPFVRVKPGVYALLSEYNPEDFASSEEELTGMDISSSSSKGDVSPPSKRTGRVRSMSKRKRESSPPKTDGDGNPLRRSTRRRATSELLPRRQSSQEEDDEGEYPSSRSSPRSQHATIVELTMRVEAQEYEIASLRAEVAALKEAVVSKPGQGGDEVQEDVQ